MRNQEGDTRAGGARNRKVKKETSNEEQKRRNQE
jgi:hypothetical protein